MMANRVLVMAGAVVALLSPSILADESLPDWAARIRKDHPRLFFNAETWPAVRARALGVERSWYEQFKSRVDKLEAELAGPSVSRASRPRIEGGTPSTQAAACDLGPEAAWSAFVFPVTDEAKYLDLAKKGMKPEDLAMMGQWRVEVSPGAARKADVFLHVIRVGDQKLQRMDKTELLQEGQRCGVRLSTGGRTWEVTFNTNGPLGGHIRRMGGSGTVDGPLATTVQPQSGI